MMYLQKWATILAVSHWKPWQLKPFPQNAFETFQLFFCSSLITWW